MSQELNVYSKELQSLLFLFFKGGQNKFPSVNGLDDQQHVVLDVTREGTLTCSMDGVSSNVELDWNYINRDSRTIELHGQRHSSVVNGDGTYNITSITTYEAIDDSIQSVILKCRVLNNADDLYPLYTTVELNFPTVGKTSAYSTYVSIFCVFILVYV